MNELDYPLMSTGIEGLMGFILELMLNNSLRLSWIELWKNNLIFDIFVKFMELN